MVMPIGRALLAVVVNWVRETRETNPLAFPLPVSMGIG
jgi:hypothetical protein